MKEHFPKSPSVFRPVLLLHHTLLLVANYLNCGHEKMALRKSQEAQSAFNSLTQAISALLSKIIGLSYNVFSNYCFAFSSSSSCYLGGKGCPISVQSLGEAASLLKACALAYLGRG
jgi:hypothetical protein